MAKLTKLITYAYLKGEVDIPQSIPDDELDHKIYRAQETLRMLMGDPFYQDYLAQFAAGPLTGAYLTLYPYVKQYVAWQAKEYYNVVANYKPTRAGFRVHTEENSVVATDTQMGTIIKIDKQSADFYKQLLVSYLDNHASDYTLYSSVSCGTSSKTGNGFHISAVRNKHRRGCGCGCHA